MTVKNNPLLLLVLVLFFASVAHATWWDDSYSYKVPLTISVPTDQNLYAYTRLSFVISTSALISAGKLQSNCNDLRVIKNDSTVMNIGVYSCNSATTTIYFRADDRETHGASNTDYSLYYGNANATKYPNDPGKWNGAYDTFNGSGSDSNFFTIGTWSQSSGTLNNSAGSSPQWARYAVHGFEVPSDTVKLYAAVAQTDGNNVRKSETCFGDSVSTNLEAPMNNGWCHIYAWTTGAKLDNIVFKDNALYSVENAMASGGVAYISSTQWTPGPCSGAIGCHREAYNDNAIDETDLFTTGVPDFEDHLSNVHNFLTSTPGNPFAGETFYPIIGNGDYNSGVHGNAKFNALIANYFSNTVVTTGSEMVNFTADDFTVVDISNVSHEFPGTYILFRPGTQTDDIIFSIESDLNSGTTVPLEMINSLTDGRQYFIYTATQAQYDAGEWSFDDTGTFGNTNSTPIQKIWDETNNRYSYTQDYFFGASDKVYFKLVYKNPYRHYFSLGSQSEWINLLPPNENNTEAIPFDDYSLSQFTNLRSVFLQNVPDISGDETQAYEMQFTAWADDNATIIYVGQTVNDNDNVSGGNITLTTSPHTYSVTINATDSDSQILIKTMESTVKNIHIRDYVVVPRGYFTSRLGLTKQNGEPLNLFLLNDVSTKYLQEGTPFKVTTKAYDREGHLQELDIEGFFDHTADDVNQVSKQVIAIDPATESNLVFDQVLDGIVDLNGNASNPASPRNLIIKATLKDDSGNAIAIQSEPLSFVQYPYFNGDVSIIFLPTEGLKGKNPKGLLQANISNPQDLLGYDIRIWDANTGGTITNPAYQKRIYQGTDFTCTGDNCSVNLFIDDYLFEHTGLTYIAVTAILSTENFSLQNQLIQSVRTLNIGQISFDTAKIHQVVERSDNTYRNDEEIPLVLILKDSEANNLKDKLDVYLTLRNCNAGTGGNCVAQSTKYRPTGYLYDDKYHYNFYFFRYLYVLDNGNLLPDGNFIGYRATINDKTGIIQSVTPTLANKCKNNDFDALTFFTSSLVSILDSLLSPGQCNTPQESIVSTSTNSGQEIRLDINTSKVTTSPLQELLVCLNPDTNNVIGDPLKANLICAAWYQVAEKPIDDFRLRVTNNYSDTSVTDSTRQYLEFNVPYEVIAYNDLPLLRKELETNQNTSIDTVGEFFLASFLQIAKENQFISGIQNLSNFTVGNGLITNVGADLNFNQAFNPATIGGVVFYRMKGLPIINANDFKNDSRVSADFENLNKKQFLEYLSNKGITYSSSPAKMDVFVSDFSNPIQLTDANGHLVMNELPSTQSVNNNNLDANHQSKYQFIPTILSVNLSHTMFYNNFGSNSSLSTIINITLLLKDNFFNGIIGFVNEVKQDPGSAFGDFVFKNAIIIFLGLGFFYILSVIWSRVRRPGPGG